MNPNAPSWGGGGGYYQPQQNNQQQQQPQYGYQQQYPNQYQQQPQQQQYQQYPQQGYGYPQMQQQQQGQYQQQYYQQPQQQQQQFYQQSHQQQNRGGYNDYNRNNYGNNNYNQNNYRNQYRGNNNFRSNNNNNNNNNNNTNNRVNDPYDRSYGYNQNNTNNQNINQLSNQMANVNVNVNNERQAQSQQQQQQQIQSQGQQQQQQPVQQPVQQQIQSTQQNETSMAQTKSSNAVASTNFDDDDEDDNQPGQAQAGTTGKKKKRKKRKKKNKGGGDGAPAAANTGGNTNTGTTAQQSTTTPQNESINESTPQQVNTSNTSPSNTNEQSVSNTNDATGASNTEETSEVSKEKEKEKESEKESKSQTPKETPVKIEKSKQKQKEKQNETKGKSKKNDKKGGNDKKEERKEGEPDSKKSDKKGKSKKKKPPKANVDLHDEREHLNLVLIGHVDAGKSTLSGQILLQTGQIDDRTIAKYEKEAKERNRESWWIAYIMDEDDEERAKGKTVECGRAHFETSLKRYTILDAPGHKNYVPNMISGASQADVALLVISARKGEFDAGFNRGGQTREHALLAFTLGISRVVIVINKMDTCKWSKERYDDIEKKVKQFLIDIGFKSKYIDCVPVSGQSGLNVSPIKPIEKDTKDCLWWKGKTLLDTLDNLKKLKRSSGGSLRIPILDRYKGDKGLQAIGKVESGHISVGDTVIVMPTNTTCRISNLTIDDVNVKNAVAGENLLISFESQKTNLSMDNIFSGCVLCNQGDLTPVTNNFTAAIALQSELPNNGIVTKGYTAMFHCHNVTSKCEIVTLKHLVRKDGKRSRAPPPFLRAKQSAIVDIRIEGNDVAIEEYKNVAQLGRFTLRDSGQTVAIGRIEHIPDKDEQKSSR